MKKLKIHFCVDTETICLHCMSKVIFTEIRFVHFQVNTEKKIILIAQSFQEVHLEQSVRTYTSENLRKVYIIFLQCTKTVCV